MSQPSVTLASKCEWGFQTCDPGDATTPQSDCWEAGGTREAAIYYSFRWWGKQDWPQIGPWGVYERNEFSWPRGLHLPLYRKLHSFIWCMIFDVQTACSLCYKLGYSLISPLPSQSSLSGLLRCCLPGSESLTLPPNNVSLCFQVLTVFFSGHYLL